MAVRSLSAGVLHQEREGGGPEGGVAAAGRLLPHRGHDEQRGEGESGPAPSERLSCGRAAAGPAPLHFPSFSFFLFGAFFFFFFLGTINEKAPLQQAPRRYLKKSPWL